MGVEKDSHIAANYHVNRPSLIGNTNESSLNSNSARPGAFSPPYGSQAAAAAPGLDVQSLNSFFRTNQHNKNIPEILWLKAAKQINNITVVGAVLLLVLSIKDMIEKNYFEATFFFLAGVALIFCSVSGNRRRDWRLVLAVAIIAFVVSFFSAVKCILTIVATVQTFKLSDAELAKLGYSSRGPVLGIGVLDCIFFVLATIYWGLVSYLNGKIVQIMMDESARTSEQPAAGNEATSDASVGGKYTGMGRDMTRAGTFVELV